MTRFVTAALGIALLLTTILGGTVTAYPDKTGICHRTASDSNPYVLIFPDHKSHDAHLGEADAGPANQHPPKHGRQDYVATAQELAQGYCGDNPPPPPPPGGTVTATGFVCGDPRVYLTTVNTTQEPQPILIRFVSAKTGEVVRLDRIAPVGIKTYVRFWVKGRTLFFVKYEGERIFSLWTGRNNNIGACPRG